MTAVTRASRTGFGPIWPHLYFLFSFFVCLCLCVCVCVCLGIGIGIYFSHPCYFSCFCSSSEDMAPRWLLVRSVVSQSVRTLVSHSASQSLVMAPPSFSCNPEKVFSWRCTAHNRQYLSRVMIQNQKEKENEKRKRKNKRKKQKKKKTKRKTEE